MSMVMMTRGFVVLSLSALLPLVVVAADQERSKDPDPAKGKKDGSGYTNCKFVTRAIKDGKVVDVPFEADFWLPPGYEKEIDRRYPVIYVLQNMDIPRRELAEMIRNGQFPPFIVVHTMGITQPLNRGEGGVWSDAFGPSGTIFRKELTAWVEKHFRCVPGAMGRVLIGCSKAGGGVMHLGLNYPDVFSAVVSADGAMRLYDVGGKDGNYYEMNKVRFFDAIERHGDAAKDLPALLLLGSMFGSGGENDEYLKRLKASGMRDLEFQDCRHYGHDCPGMTNASFPEVMATFYNGIGDFAPWKPALSHRGSVQAGSFDVTARPAEADWTIRYTLDGSDSHKAGQTAKGPIHVDKSCWLRVIGIAPDGKKQSRETLMRYTIQAPLPATTLGKEPGLTLRAYEGSLGKNLKDYLADIQKGARKPVAEAVVAGLGESAALLKKADDKTGTLAYTGTLTVPETRVYEFELEWAGGLFFPEHGKPWNEVGRQSHTIATVSVPLEKGSHPILMLQFVSDASKGGDRPMKLSTRQPDGTFKPIPRDWYRQ